MLGSGVDRRSTRWDIDSASGFDPVFISVSRPGGQCLLDVSALLIHPPRRRRPLPRPEQEWQLTRIG
ncbi:hypothetical protein ACWDKQ_00165 [Saccharopolyspora sp. NPDC000995]